MTKNTSKSSAKNTTNKVTATRKQQKSITVKLVSGHGSYIPWAGAKSWSFDVLRKFIPQDAQRLVFACAGAGSDAVAYAALGLPMVLADLNPDAICAHQWVQKNAANAIRQLGKLFTKENNTKAGYYKLRDEFNQTKKNTPRRAALFIYLLWHSNHGICRYNQKGQFNNGFGARHQAKQAVAVPEDAIRRFSGAMSNATFIHQSLLDTLSQAKAGDAVIIDPPYLPAEDKDTCHTGYTAAGFGIEDHRAMVAAIEVATARGVMVITHDHLTKTTRELHRAASKIQPIEVPRRIARKRGTVTEGIFIYEAARPVPRFYAHGVLTQQRKRLCGHAGLPRFAHSACLDQSSLQAVRQQHCRAGCRGRGRGGDQDFLTTGGTHHNRDVCFLRHQLTTTERRITMPYYTVTIEDRIYCSGTIRVEADNAAAAAILARTEAWDGNVRMSPMENGEEGPRVYKIEDTNGDHVVTLGDEGFEGTPNKGCLTEHINALLEKEGAAPRRLRF